MRQPNDCPGRAEDHLDIGLQEPYFARRYSIVNAPRTRTPSFEGFASTMQDEKRWLLPTLCACRALAYYGHRFINARETGQRRAALNNRDSTGPSFIGHCWCMRGFTTSAH